MGDQCPVCKSDRYLNPKLRLLVSACYHKMCVRSVVLVMHWHYPSDKNDFFRCESCIDRLFTLGPAPCPLCNKVLRKLAFMPQTFEDLGVEKEVAIRRRIAKECATFDVQTREQFLNSTGLINDAKIFLTCDHTMTILRRLKT